MNNPTISHITTSQFIPTKEHLRFEEFAEACKKYRYIGLCYGKPGIGKSFSANHYAKWGAFRNYKLIDELDDDMMQNIEQCKAILYTAPITNTPKKIAEKLGYYRPSKTNSGCGIQMPLGHC